MPSCLIWKVRVSRWECVCGMDDWVTPLHILPPISSFMFHLKVNVSCWEYMLRCGRLSNYSIIGTYKYRTDKDSALIISARGANVVFAIHFSISPSAKWIYQWYIPIKPTSVPLVLRGDVRLSNDSTCMAAYYIETAAWLGLDEDCSNIFLFCFGFSKSISAIWA